MINPISDSCPQPQPVPAALAAQVGTARDKFEQSEDERGVANATRNQPGCGGSGLPLCQIDLGPEESKARDDVQESGRAGGPPLRFLQRWEPECSHVTVPRFLCMLDFRSAQSASALLRNPSSALHHLQLSSPASLLGQRPTPRPVPAGLRAGAPTIRFRGGRIRGHAGTYSPADQRTGEGRPIEGDAGHQTGFRAARVATGAPTSRVGTTGIICRRQRACLAASFL